MNIPSLISLLKWTDRWKCQCLMIARLAFCLDENKLFQKSLEILATIISFLTLILSILSLKEDQQIELYFPVYGHFLINSYSMDRVQSYESLQQRCHYFEDLSHVRFVGFNQYTFYEIRIIILFVLFVTDMLGLLFSFVHPPCGTKMYIFGLSVTLLFFVLFPSQFCINFGDTCIEYSPIFFIYRVQFMILFNVAWLGIASILLIILIVPITYWVSQNFNKCGVNSIFYELIYGLASIPFVLTAVINFITALWTSSALINILTFASTIINYFLYHSGTDLKQKMLKKQKNLQIQMEMPEDLLFDQQNLQMYDPKRDFWQINLEKSKKGNHILNPKGQFIQNEKQTFTSPKKPDRLRFYRQWQEKLYKQFTES